MNNTIVSIWTISELLELARKSQSLDGRRVINPTVFVSLLRSQRTTSIGIREAKFHLDVSAPTANGSGIVYLYRQTLFEFTDVEKPADIKEMLRDVERVRDDVIEFLRLKNSVPVRGSVVIDPDVSRFVVEGSPLVEWDSDLRTFTRPKTSEPDPENDTNL